MVPQAPDPLRRGAWAPGPWIEVRLSTEDDLSRFRRVHATDVWGRVSLCTEGRFDERRRLKGGLLSGAARRGETDLSQTGINSSPDAQGRYTYFVYLAIWTPG